MNQEFLFLLRIGGLSLLLLTFEWVATRSRYRDNTPSDLRPHSRVRNQKK